MPPGSDLPPVTAPELLLSDEQPPVLPAPPAAAPLSRALFALLGSLLLLLCATFTLGLALLAPVGMAVAWAISRRRRRPLTRGGTWLGAMLGTSIGIATIFVVALALAPSGTLDEVERNARVEAQRNPPQPPKWLERMSPEVARRATQPDAQTQSIVNSRAFLLWTGIMGVTFASVFIGAVIGSAGWAGATLVVYGLNGRWLPSRA